MEVKLLEVKYWLGIRGLAKQKQELEVTQSDLRKQPVNLGLPILQREMVGNTRT